MRTYLISPPFDQPRQYDHSRQEAICQVWTFAPSAPDMHGTLAVNALRFDPGTMGFRLVANPWDGFSLPGASSVMSSAMILYRLLCVFGHPPLMRPVADQYKSLWDYPLQHRPTGEYLTLNDQKAGWSIRANFTDSNQLPPAFADDLLALLDFLVSDTVVHPYDSTVAGSVA